MTATADTRLRELPWATPGKAVVAAVDGSDRNGSAVDWAVDLAARTGRPLALVAVIDDHSVPLPHYPTVAERDRHWPLLQASAERVASHHPRLTVRRSVEIGATVARLVEVTAAEHTLVVGKRGLGGLGRMVIGSTSIGVAGRADVPVVIVPDGWEAASRVGAPVVVGIDPGNGNDQPLLYAFGQAQERGVDLVVVHSLDLNPILMGDRGLGSAVYDEWTAQSTRQLDEAVAPVREQFPDVTTQLVHAHGHPGGVLLTLAKDAQLLVLGRRRHSRLGGFAFGSVTRGVLHASKLPVAVVPACTVRVA